jgi:hypothetical protein
MTRTYIIAADGTRFEAIPARIALRNKILRRMIAALVITLTAIFLSAVIIGFSRAATEGAGAPHTAPTAAHITTLPEMQRACRKAPKGAKQDCYALYLRRAWSDPRGSDTAAGPLLVRDCISQYRGAELADCFTQEIG